MNQTVYDVGDLITSRINLGVTPDGSTQASVTVQRPDGAVITGLMPTGWVGMEKTVQFYATSDGTAGGLLAPAAGDWLVIWYVTGTGASVSPKVYNVSPLPGATSRPVWSPFLSRVADHVPFLTVDTTTPGQQVYLGTFTGVTTPTDEVAQRHIDSAVALMTPAIPAISAALYPAATAVAALRAAASLARAYPRRPEDLNLAAALEARADAAWKVLVEAAENEGTAASTVGTPHFYFPAPRPWGDLDL